MTTRTPTEPPSEYCHHSSIWDGEMSHLCVYFISFDVFLDSWSCVYNLLYWIYSRSPNVISSLLAHHVLKPGLWLTGMIVCLQCVEALVAQVNERLNFEVIKLHIFALKQQTTPPGFVRRLGFVLLSIQFILTCVSKLTCNDEPCLAKNCRLLKQRQGGPWSRKKTDPGNKQD